MKHPGRVSLEVLIAFIVITGSACGAAGTSSTPSPVISSSSSDGKLDPAVATPNGFPSDFPVYPGARLTRANEATSNGQATWGMEWETPDGVDAVQSFYTTKLKQGDWTLTYSSSASAGFSAIFTRKSNQSDAGLLTVEQQTNATHIDLAFGTTA
jgi:hypothetical protein